MWIDALKCMFADESVLDSLGITLFHFMLKIHRSSVPLHYFYVFVCGEKILHCQGNHRDVNHTFATMNSDVWRLRGFNKSSFDENKHIARMSDLFMHR